MLKNKLLKRLSLLFILSSVVLWGGKFYITHGGATCNSASSESAAFIQFPAFPWTQQPERNGADYDDSNNNKRDPNTVEHPAQWLQRKIHTLSPSSNSSSSVQSCPALASSNFSPPPRPAPDTYFGTLGVTGELQLRLGGTGSKLASEGDVETWMRGLSGFVSNTSAVLASFSTAIQKSDDTAVLMSLRGLDARLVVSLANTAFSQQAASSDESSSLSTTRSLEGAGIQWLGMHAKKYHVVVIGGRHRVGVLAFCGVLKECSASEGNSLPFSPVKYTQKAAKSAVKELREHGITLMVVLMYWGLQSSYFPDETALTVARQLAQLGVGAVLGHHPNSVQDHAYFGNTLVVFSLGKLLSSTKATDYCWNKVSDEWTFASTRTCKTIHPQNRASLLNKEQQTRIYKLHIFKMYPIVAEYVTVKLEEQKEDYHTLRKPLLNKGQHYQWTRVCSDSDKHCLACQQF